MNQEPKPNTTEMVRLIADALISLIDDLPMKFSNADVMSAAATIVIQTGMVAVREGVTTRELLIADVTKGIADGVRAWPTEDEGSPDWAANCGGSA